MRPVIVLTLLCLALGAAFPTAALADGQTRTTLRVAAPASADLGEAAEVQAQLVDAAGKPIAGALVLFTAPLSFLEASGEVVLADATTGADGIATTEVDLRSEGSFAISAVFKGDAAHAPSSAQAEMAVSGGAQLYAQTAGVKVPGLNSAPTVPGTNAALFETSRLFPRLSGWPIALALMTVWSLYASVVVVLFRITAASRSAS